MIRRAVRMFVAEVCLLSLLACLGVGWLWWRSHRGDRPRFSLRLPATRYTVRTEPGRLTLWGPPPPATAAGAAKANRAAALLRNRDIRMTVFATVMMREFELERFSDAGPETDTPAEELWNANADAIPPLLDALEDPERFAAAHVLLTHRLVPNRAIKWAGGSKYVDADEQGDASHLAPARPGTVWAVYNSMSVELWPVRSEIDRLMTEDREEPHAITAKPIRMHARVSPAQLPSLRDHWHDKLDVPLGSAPHWALVAGLAVPPALWGAVRGRRTLRRRRRSRLGLCVACGYDLRSIAVGRCPECGMQVCNKEAAAA
jgi:hypothetical protein